MSMSRLRSFAMHLMHALSSVRICGERGKRRVTPLRDLCVTEDTRIILRLAVWLRLSRLTGPSAIFQQPGVCVRSTRSENGKVLFCLVLGFVLLEFVRLLYPVTQSPEGLVTAKVVRSFIPPLKHEGFLCSPNLSLGEGQELSV